MIRYITRNQEMNFEHREENVMKKETTSHVIHWVDTTPRVIHWVDDTESVIHWTGDDEGI